MGLLARLCSYEIAVVFKLWWDKKMNTKLQENWFQVKLYKCYVDDIIIIVILDSTNNTDVEVDWATVMTKIKSIGNEIHQSIQLDDD